MVSNKKDKKKASAEKEFLEKERRRFNATIAYSRKRALSLTIATCPWLLTVVVALGLVGCLEINKDAVPRSRSESRHWCRNWRGNRGFS
jgi:hypothetical protein